MRTGRTVCDRCGIETESGVEFQVEAKSWKNPVKVRSGYRDDFCLACFRHLLAEADYEWPTRTIWGWRLLIAGAVIGLYLGMLAEKYWR